MIYVAFILACVGSVPDPESPKGMNGPLQPMEYKENE